MVYGYLRVSGCTTWHCADGVPVTIQMYNVASLRPSVNSSIGGNGTDGGGASVARPTSLGGGRARLSARLRGTQGGGVSPPDLPSRAHRGSTPADLPRMHARLLWGSAAALAPLAVASGSDRHAWRATEWGRLPGGAGGRSARPSGWPGPRGPKAGAQQPPIGCPPARPQPERLLR